MNRASSSRITADDPGLWSRVCFLPFFRLMTSVLALSGFGLLAVPSLGAQETVFRLDGQLGKDGRTQLSLPLQDGAQVVFRLASLDFQARLRITLNGQDFQQDADGQLPLSQFLHVRKSGVAQVTVESPSGQGVAAASFQLRVVRLHDNATLGKTSLVKGFITPHDQREGKNRFIDWYPLPVSKGQHFLVGVSSRAGDAALRLEMPDGSNLSNEDAIGNDARVLVDVAESGIAWVGAAVLIKDEAVRDDLSIPYQLYVREWQGTTRPLVQGQPVTGQAFAMVADDLPPLPENYSFIAPRAGVYRFRLEGRDGAQPVLQGLLENERSFVDTAERGLRDWAQIRCYLRQNQKMDLVAGSLAGSGHPQYNLNVLYDNPAVVLKDGDNLERLIQDQHQGFYLYRGRPGEYVEFLMTSDDFETRLQLSDPLGQTFVWSKYFGSDFSYASLGGYWFDQAGEVLLETGSKTPGDDGLYQLTVRSSLSDSLSLPREVANRTLLNPGAAVFARINDRHPLVRGGYADEFTIDLKQGELLAIRLQSTDVPARLVVSTLEGTELAGTGDGASRDVTIELGAPRTGRYLVRVMVPCADGKSLNARYTVAADILGNISTWDPDLVNRNVDLILPSDRPASEAPWSDVPLRLRSAQRVYLSVDSSDFQPVIKLLDKDGMVLDENHGVGIKGRSRIDFTVLKGGSYRLRILRGPILPGSNASAWHCTVSAYEVR